MRHLDRQTRLVAAAVAGAAAPTRSGGRWKRWQRRWEEEVARQEGQRAVVVLGLLATASNSSHSRRLQLTTLNGTGCWGGRAAAATTAAGGRLRPPPPLLQLLHPLAVKLWCCLCSLWTSSLARRLALAVALPSLAVTPWWQQGQAAPRCALLLLQPQLAATTMAVAVHVTARLL